MEFSEQIKNFLTEEYPDIDIDNLSLEELKSFREELVQKRQELNLLEKTQKLLGNGAYGSCASPWFYFFNVELAGDITGECRLLTKTMWKNMEEWFHEKIWERKDLWEQFDFALDPAKKEWYKTQPVSIYSDTDSVDGKSLIRIKDNNVEESINIEDLFLRCIGKYDPTTITSSGQEIVPSDVSVLNYSNDRLSYNKVNYIMRHRVNKKKYKIRTDSGKEIIVTEDHSCIVYRNGEKCVVKASEIKDTDKLLCTTFKN